MSFEAITPTVMGILNCTPDSFSDGGHFLNADSALAQALLMQHEGADIIDVGGESTRPGAKRVSVDEELSRIVPVIEKIKRSSDVRISVDTSKAEVMHEALALGVDMINDVNAFEAEGTLDAVASSSCQLCLMHKKGLPEVMQHNPLYYDVVTEVYDYLKMRIQACADKGINADRLILDIGFGFGKTVNHNLSLIKHLQRFTALGPPLLTAVSRKSTIGAVLNRSEADRLTGSLSLAVVAYLNGARFFRVHDVRQTIDALKMVQVTYQAS